MKNKRLYQLILAALMTALTCMATLIVQIPSPLNGYVNLGECFVLLSPWLLGPVYGAVAAGLGAALADLLAGYVIYAPGTLIIKALVALTAWWIVRGSHITWKRVVGAILAEVVMVGGYFLYESLILGYGLGALSGVPGNIVQAVVGIVVSVLLAVVLGRIPFFKTMIYQTAGSAGEERHE